MGTTLENGVYLPSEGERNCYAGLKTNWEILDQKVADVTALQQAVAGALHRQIVASLPTTDIDPNTIYMILSGTSATENVYNEFMYVNNAWELIGTSATDLTNYYTKAEVDGKLLLKANASDLTSHTGDTTIHVTTADKNRWNNNTYVFRYSSTALTASSTNSNALLDNTDNLKVGDKVIDSSGVLFSITAIDTQNSTFTIGTALIDLAQDSNVVHKSGNETVAGNKRFTGLTTTAPDSTLWPINTQTTDDITFLHSSAVHVEQRGSGNLTDLSNGAWNIANLGYGCFFFRNNSGTDIRYKHLALNTVNRIYIVSNGNRQLNNVTPETDNTYSLGDSTRRWSTINGLEPSALGMPDLDNGIDISSYFDATQISTNAYTAPSNGYINLAVSSPNRGSINAVIGSVFWVTTAYGAVNPNDSNSFLQCMLVPILKNQTITVYLRTTGGTIESAKFYPCLGNV